MEKCCAEGGETTGVCTFREGTLPSCAPLAVSYVPMQESSQPAYDSELAIQRGTLFPGLDLPFMNVVNNRDVADTPLGELMAISFAAHELLLYLDTHPEDTEAFTLLQQMLRMKDEAHRRYVKKYGPLTHNDLASSDCFDWLNTPWPWSGQE